MSRLLESLKKGPAMTMTLECETEFPKALKDLMLSMGLEGAAVYKGFPFKGEGKSTGGCNSIYTRTKTMTTRPKVAACSQTQ